MNPPRDDAVGGGRFKGPIFPTDEGRDCKVSIGLLLNNPPPPPPGNRHSYYRFKRNMHTQEFKTEAKRIQN